MTSTTLTAEEIGGKPLGEAQKKKSIQLAAVVTVVGVVLAAVAASTDSHRFAASYLVGFSWITTIALGALFFVLIQHLTKAGWSVAARRPMEWVGLILPACAVLFIPILIFQHDIFHHWMSAEALEDPIIKGKSGYLNPTFFHARAAFYFVVWAALSWFYYSKSRKQDETGDPALTNSMQKVAAPGVLLFGVTITFAAFDWLMSLDPHWYSTIYGVYVFAGAATSALAALALITLRLKKAGALGKVSTVEHQHDIGKLLFGFIVFWAYIGFSQFFLIWYANIPEETIFFRMRGLGGWMNVSLVLLFGHFVIPFMGLLSRHSKRSPQQLAAFAFLILVMHYVDLYWLVMPNFSAEFSPSWIDLAGVIAPLGVGGLVVAYLAKSSPAYPLRDPRLPETLRCENL